MQRLVFDLIKAFHPRGKLIQKVTQSSLSIIEVLRREQNLNGSWMRDWGIFIQKWVAYMDELHIDVWNSGVGDSAKAEHLPDQNSKGPDIALVVDHPGFEDLRSHPPNRETRADAGQILYWGVEGPRQTKVRHLGHSFVFLEENISGGQITVDNFIFLKKLHPSANLRRNIILFLSLLPLSLSNLITVLQESLTRISSNQV